jgi:hypothetical protein
MTYFLSPEFIALGVSRYSRKRRPQQLAAAHRSTTCRSAQVALQRCPILRAGDRFGQGDSVVWHGSVLVGPCASARLRPGFIVMAVGESRSIGRPRSAAESSAPQRRRRVSRLAPLRVEYGLFGPGSADCRAEEVVRRSARPPLLPWLAERSDRLIRTTRH